MNQVKELIKFNVKRYPLMEINDVIKLLYQRSFGCGHVIKNKDKAKKFLLEEFKDTISDSSLPLVEEIGNDFIRAGGGGKPSCPSPSAGDLRELPRVPLRGEGSCPRKRGRSAGSEMPPRRRAWTAPS